MKKTFSKRLWAWITSLKLTIFTLIILAGTSVIGTIIPQNEPPQKYLQYYSPETYNILKLLDLDNMYHSWWFTALMALFTLNLVCCTVKRFPGFYKAMTAKETQPGDEFLQALPYKRSFRLKSWSDATRAAVCDRIGRHLRIRFSGQENQEGFSLFAERGKYSRLGFYTTHLGIVLIICGGMLGNYGYQGFMQLVEGETADSIALRGGAGHKKLDFSIRCDDFEATFYPGSQRPKDYKSTLTIIDDGKEIRRKIIEVNDPLTYKGVYIYQSSYGSVPGAGHILLRAAHRDNATRVREYKVRTGDRFALDDPAYEVAVKRFVPDFSMDEGRRVFSRSRDPKNPALQIALFRNGSPIKETWIFANFPDFHGAGEEPYRFVLAGFAGREYTGLQLTRDPGVEVVWAGCILLTLGSYLIFFTSHRRLWLRVTAEEGHYHVTMAGTSSKNREAFGQLFETIYRELRKPDQTAPPA